MTSPIVLDPGHGGGARRGSSTAEGATLGGGRSERQVSWALAQQVARDLPGAQLTRGEQDNPSLGERIAFGRKAGAGVFLSLHASPAPESAVWIHTRAGPASAQLAERVSGHLAPVWGGRVEVRRGDLAVLSPDHHAPGTAACLLDLGVQNGARPLPLAAAAVARGVRGHFGRLAYGRGPERGLDLAQPLPEVNTDDLRRAWNARQAGFRAGVADTSLFPYSAICRLIIDNDPESWGTGFYVSPTRIVTAGHVTSDAQRVITVVPGMNGETVRPFGQFDVQKADIVTHPQFTAGGDFDLGVLRVATAPPNGAFFSHLDPTPASLGNVVICGYADIADNRKQHLDIDVIRNVNASGEQADYNASTMPGTSGSPVFYLGYEDPAQQMSVMDVGVVGVHVSSAAVAGDAAQNAVYNKCVLLTQGKLDWIWGL